MENNSIPKDLKGLIVSFPLRIQELMVGGIYVEVPKRRWIRYCTSGYTILTNHDRKTRIMGDFLLGDNRNLKFFRFGNQMLIMDKTSGQYTVIPAEMKTAGFGRKSQDDGKTLAEQFANMALYEFDTMGSFRK